MSDWETVRFGDTDYIRVPVVLRGFSLLPADEALRTEMYGTADYEACLKVDFESDSASFLVDQVEDLELEVPDR